MCPTEKKRETKEKSSERGSEIMMPAYHGYGERDEYKSRQLITLCFANII
jgi:hypothetical protein